MNLFIIGFILSSLISWISVKKKALTNSGALAAIATGTLIFGFGQKMSWYLLLVLFFVSSSLLSHYRKQDKEEVANIFEKTGQRDGWQVLANGGWAVLLAVLGYYLQREWIYIAFAASFATTNADTWATEIGVLSKKPPIFILTGKQVGKGTSGAVSSLGLIGSMLGAFFIAFLALLLLTIEGAFQGYKTILIFLIIGISGFLGALFDSFLGATVQASYQCSICEKITEKSIHCGERAKQVKGWHGMNNDMVNFISSIVGSGVASILYIGFM